MAPPPPCPPAGGASFDLLHLSLRLSPLAHEDGRGALGATAPSMLDLQLEAGRPRGRGRGGGGVVGGGGGAGPPPRTPPRGAAGPPLRPRDARPGSRPCAAPGV